MEKMNKLILITGATGFLGSAIAKRLLVAGYELKLLVRVNNRRRTIMDFILNNGMDDTLYGLFLNNVEILEGDITSKYLGLGRDVYKRLCCKVDDVFHCAAATHFEKQRTDELMNVNVDGTRNVLRLVNSGKQKRFHYISTAYVAGKQNGVIYEDDLENEPQFNNEYERSKYIAEQMVVQYAKENLIPYTIYRPSIIVGDSKTGTTCKFDNLYLFAKVLVNIKRAYDNHLIEDRKKHEKKNPGKNQITKLKIRVPGDPNTMINIVPIDYVADAIVAIVKGKKALNKIFNIVNPNPPTLRELRDLLVSALMITGIDISIDGQMERKQLSKVERLFLRQTRTYYSYLFSKLRFDCTNTQDALKGMDINCPAITQDFIKTLLNYAISHNWGEGELAALQEVKIA